MKKPFAVGDRVAVYGEFSPSEGGSTRMLDGDYGFISYFSKGHESFYVMLDVPMFEPNMSEFERRKIGPVHPKQCRRLKKKERRRVWVNKGYLNQLWQTGGFISKTKPINPEPYAEFVEVRKNRGKK